MTFNPGQGMNRKEWKRHLTQYRMKTTVEKSPGSMMRLAASSWYQGKWKHSEVLPGQRSWWSEGPGKRSLARSEVQALEAEQQVFCDPQPGWLISQAKYRPWTGLTLGIGTGCYSERWCQEGKMTRASQEALWRHRQKGLFPGPIAMELMVGKISKGIWYGETVWPGIPGYKQLLQNQRDHEKWAWEMTQNLLLKLRYHWWQKSTSKQSWRPRTKSNWSPEHRASKL